MAVANSGRHDADRDVRRTFWALGSAALIGLGGLASYALATGSDRIAALSVVGVGILIAGASFLIGTLLGFLFGIPKTMQQGPGALTASEHQQNDQDRNREGVAGNATNQAGIGARDTSTYRVNTNLEEISDWLTKILVGVGLTQLSVLPQQVWTGAGKFVTALGGANGDAGVQAVAAALIVHFLATGFFFGYLLTRLFLTGAFIRAERLSLEDVRDVLEQTQERTRQAVTEATERTESAVKGVTDLASLVDSRLVESQLVSLLYVPPPSGFQGAVQAGEAYVRSNRETASATLWVYLACAYGQQLKWEKEHENRPEVLQETREKALDAIRMALQKDASMKPWLQGLMHPIPGSVDNDLESFAGDAEFEELVR